MNKNTLMIIISIILAGLLGWLVYDSLKSGRLNQDENAQAPIADGYGRLSVTITDDTADIAAVNDISVVVDKVQVYNEAKGWVTVSDQNKTYNLLTFKADGKVAFHDSYDTAPDSYDRIKVVLGDVTVSDKTKGSVKAKLPSNEVVVGARVDIHEGRTSVIEFDFIADQSLHTTEDGQYVFAPVVEVESRNNVTLTINEDDSVTVDGGNVNADVKVGVDLSGVSKTGFVLNTASGLNIGTGANGGTVFTLDGKTYTQATTTSILDLNFKGI